MSNPHKEKPYEKLKSLEEALEIAKKSSNISEIFQILLKLAELCQEIKANELGLKYVQEAIEFSKKYSTSDDLHEFYKYMGDFKFELGLLEEAKEAYNTSIKKAGRKKFYQILAENHLRLGRIDHFQDNLKQAINHFKKAENLYGEMSLYIEQAKLYNQIGLMYINKISETPEESKFDKRVFHSAGIGIQGSSSFKKAQKNFKKAKMILEERNLIEKETVLYRSILSNLDTKFKDFK